MYGSGMKSETPQENEEMLQENKKFNYLNVQNDMPHLFKKIKLVL